MLDITNLIVYVNGEFVPGPEAHVSVFDRGLLYGDAVFEGIREYSGGSSGWTSTSTGCTNRRTSSSSRFPCPRTK